MSQEIKDALLKLDVKNDDHWTGDGSPRVDALGIKGLKRGDIVKAAPQFTRETPTVEIGKVDSEGTYLLGSSIQPEEFFLKDGTKMSLGDVVAKSFDLSGLTIDVWNELPEGEREESIQDYINTLDVVYEDEIVPEQPEGEQELSLEAQKEHAEHELEIASKARVDATKAEDMAKYKLDLVKEAIEKSKGVTSNQDEIMRYIKSQNELRMKRAQKYQAVIASGVDINAVASAPIDRAMSRKNSRGTQRPVRAMNNDSKN